MSFKGEIRYITITKQGGTRTVAVGRLLPSTWKLVEITVEDETLAVDSEVVTELLLRVKLIREG